MAQVVQCVPNISEGRRPEVIEAIVNQVRQVPGVALLDTLPDIDHNRTVITFIGEMGPVKEAAFQLTKKAIELIDMEKQTGGHPRIGAVDVIPLIPINEVEMTDCIDGAKELAQRVSRELGVPTYLYGEAAQRPERKNLSNIRKGQYEALKLEIGNQERQPDFGLAEMHPSAGATMVGARMPLIAFNINLATDQKWIADKIARAVRESSGGFKNVKGMGLVLTDRNQVQVSMNLENYQKTPIYRVFEAVQREALRYGVNVVGSEIIGLVPQQALVDVAEWYLRVEGFNAEQVLENRL